MAAQAHPALFPHSLGTDGSAKLGREAARDSRGSQRELDEGQGEFPLQHAIPRYGASQAKLITMVSKVLLVPGKASLNSVQN